MVVALRPLLLQRHRRGKGFSYTYPNGSTVRDPATLRRIRALAIPPAWTDVVVAESPDAHIQATGRDARGRKQYRYHARWIELRDREKYDRLIAFTRVLPRIRAAVARDLRLRKLPTRKILAALVAMLETCHMRIGNDEYARENGSYGATTLENGHVRFKGRGAVELVYRAKGGIVRHVRVTDPRLTRVIRACRALPGKRLFPVTSAEVNAYIADISHGPFTAKDFRTWGGTREYAKVYAATHDRKAALEAAADALGNTCAVCRKSYIHPRVYAGDVRGFV